MNDCCDLELTIHRQDQKYAVDFRFSEPNSQVDVGAGARTEMFANFNLAELQKYLGRGDMKGYGAELTRQFFADSTLKSEFAGFRKVIDDRKDRLRVRLNIKPSALELYQLRWETLNDPGSGVSLATDQIIYFSRYLVSTSIRRIQARPKEKLKALVMVASPDPEELKKYDPPLAKVDKDAEVKAIKGSLGDATIKELEKATLDRLTEAMTSDEYDLLYVVAHGVFGKDNEGQLLLEDEQTGKDVRASATEFVSRMSGLEHPPRLIVLASCQSGGKGTGDILSALGPRLAEAGIPAVLAMQDDLTINTNARFMPLFFTQLQKHGQIDRALNVARGQVESADDFWVPVLFMRLKDGRLWEVPAEQLASQGVEGIKASAALFKLSPETYTRTIKSFENPSQQIGRLADYKDLHDLLHKLQFDIYNTAKYPVERFARDVSDTDELREYEIKLGKLVSDLNRTVTSPSVNPVEKDWVSEIETAHTSFEKALDEGNDALLQECFGTLKRIIKKRPSRINSILTEAARALQLNALAEALQSVSKEAQESGLEASQVSLIQEGADAILALSNKLTSLVQDHDYWQDVTIDLDSIEESDLADLKSMWGTLKIKVERLFANREEDWAIQLRVFSEALDEAIKSDNPAKMKSAFRKYRSGAGDRFFKVDTDLKNHCGEIRNISGPLKKAIDLMEKSSK